MNKPGGSDKGFTLVELLVALTMMTLLATLVFTGLRLGTRVWQAVSIHAEEGTEAFQIQNFMRHLLTRAREVRLRDGNGELRPGFKGEEHRLLFVAPLAEPVGNGEPHWFALQLEEVRREDGVELESVLALYYWPFQHLEEDQLETEEQQMVDWEEFWAPEALASRTRIALWDGIFDLRLEYFGTRELAERPNWETVWEEPQLPDLVRLEFVDPDSISEEELADHWPPLLVAPLAKSYAIKQPL